MSIGIKIKQLRKEKKITQEELAEMLGITSRAISQWECERTYPDITLLPLLANIFNVSIDYLLGVNINNNIDKINNYIDESNKYLQEGNHIERTILLRNALKEFPNSFELMNLLSDSILNEIVRDKDFNDYSEVINLCERILARCNDNNIITETKQRLAIAYLYNNQYDQMVKITNQMPSFHDSKEIFMLDLYSINNIEGLISRQQLLSDLFTYSLSLIESIKNHIKNDNPLEFELQYSLQDRIQIGELQVKLIELLYNQNDYGYNAIYGVQACNDLVICYIQNNEINKAIEHLEKWYNYSLYLDKHYKQNDSKYKSLLFNYIKMENYCLEDKTNIEILLDFINNNKYMKNINQNEKVLEIKNKLMSQ